MKYIYLDQADTLNVDTLNSGLRHIKRKGNNNQHLIDIMMQIKSMKNTFFMHGLKQ